ncbi:MAG: hypothetical protein ACHQDE_01530 [Acidimicrobiia bacterium]
MSEADASEEPTTADLDGRIQEVFAALRALRADLDAHRAALEREVHTERVVIRTRDGFVRIVLTADDDTGQITVHARSGDGATCAELFANDRDVGGRAHAGLALTEAGNVVSVLELLEGEGVDLWIAPEMEEPDAE